MKINDENRTKIIGLLTILIVIWLVLYFIPELFVSLFNTLLGNLILIISVILVYSNNRMYGSIVGLIILILYRFSRLSRENFTTDSERDFLLIQNTINKQKIFDMNIINTQASQEELNYFNENGMWPWSQKVIDLYEEAINKNPYIRTVSEQATNYARTIYNETAILRALSYQTKEGQFLLNGVLVNDVSNNKLPSGYGNFVYSSGLLQNDTDDIIRCNLNNDNNPTLERIKYTGEHQPVDYNDLETIIPGFTFLNKPCNPCVNVASTPDYSCAYRLGVKDKPTFVSSVWHYLWGNK